MESMMRLYQRQPKPMRWTILKGGIFVGPGTFQEDLVKQIDHGEVVVPGDGSHYVSLVHVEDVAKAFVAALERAPAASLFNICAEPMTYGEYVDGIADRLGVARPKRDEAKTRPVSHRASAKAAKEVLGWEAKHSIWPSLPK
jgi:nucleoside-diphosphate-sugar epimerase